MCLFRFYFSSPCADVSNGEEHAAARSERAADPAANIVRVERQLGTLAEECRQPPEQRQRRRRRSAVESVRARRELDIERSGRRLELVKMATPANVDDHLQHKVVPSCVFRRVFSPPCLSSPSFFPLCHPFFLVCSPLSLSTSLLFPRTRVMTDEPACDGQQEQRYVYARTLLEVL